MRLPIRFLAGGAVIAGLAAALLVVRADELKLKDGTKITGTIVGFDDNSFKVKTNYGFALVQKDQVVSINISPAAKTDDTDKKPEASAEKAPAPGLAKPGKRDATAATVASDSTAALHAHSDPTPEPAAEKAAAPKPAPAPAKPSTANASVAAAPAKPAKPEVTVAAAVANSVAAPHAPVPGPPLDAKPASAPTTSGNAPAPVAVITSPVAIENTTAAPVAPPKPPAPLPVRESVAGNIYTNETYGLQMYKPPDWNVIVGARTLLPGTITALGTDDQNTYLLIGQAPAGKTLESDEQAADRRLGDIMENFRPLEVQHVTVSGISAIERKFRGSVDQRDWSGVVVLVPRGAQTYTIFGMTLADTDLVQIQENVIARAISSLQFTKQ